MPSTFGMTAQLGVPSVAATIPAVRSFANGVTPSFTYPYDIMGVTKDSVGAVLGLCLVQLFRTADDSYVHSTTSDASGNYAIPASNLLQHFLVAYLVGSPDVAGTTINTLTGS